MSMGEAKVYEYTPVRLLELNIYPFFFFFFAEDESNVA